MTFQRRDVIKLAALTLLMPAAALTSRAAVAQGYPSRPTRLIAPYAAGGATDLISRLAGQWLADRLGSPFVIENRPGSGSNIGTDAALRAEPDGYTLLLASSANAINASLYPKLRFDFLNDSVAVALVGTLPNILVVHPSMPVKSLAEFISYAKENPGKINMGLAGIGSPQHMSAALFASMGKIELNFIQYKGGGPVVTDLAGGHIQAAFLASSTAAPHLASGAFRGLAVTSAKRLGAQPDLPAIAEEIPGYDATNFYGIAAPKGTPQEVIDIINKEINAALADAKFVERLESIGLTPQPETPQNFAALIAAETEKWGKVIKEAGITME